MQVNKRLDQFETKQTCSHHLISEHKHGLQRELSAAVVEQVLKAWPKEIDNHHIILPLNTEPLQVWDASCNQRVENRSTQVITDVAANHKARTVP
jgi:hypothetical protein